MKNSLLAILASLAALCSFGQANQHITSPFQDADYEPGEKIDYQWNQFGAGVSFYSRDHRLFYEHSLLKFPVVTTESYTKQGFTSSGNYIQGKWYGSGLPHVWMLDAQFYSNNPNTINPNHQQTTTENKGAHTDPNNLVDEIRPGARSYGFYTPCKSAWSWQGESGHQTAFNRELPLPFETASAPEVTIYPNSNFFGKMYINRVKSDGSYANEMAYNQVQIVEKDPNDAPVIQEGQQTVLCDSGPVTLNLAGIRDVEVSVDYTSANTGTEARRFKWFKMKNDANDLLNQNPLDLVENGLSYYLSPGVIDYDNGQLFEPLEETNAHSFSYSPTEPITILVVRAERQLDHCTQTDIWDVSPPSFHIILDLSQNFSNLPNHSTTQYLKDDSGIEGNCQPEYSCQLQGSYFRFADEDVITQAYGAPFPTPPGTDIQAKWRTFDNVLYPTAQWIDDVQIAGTFDPNIPDAFEKRVCHSMLNASNESLPDGRKYMDYELVFKYSVDPGGNLPLIMCEKVIRTVRVVQSSDEVDQKDFFNTTYTTLFTATQANDQSCAGAYALTSIGIVLDDPTGSIGGLIPIRSGSQFDVNLVRSQSFELNQGLKNALIGINANPNDAQLALSAVGGTVVWDDPLIQAQAANQLFPTITDTLIQDWETKSYGFTLSFNGRTIHSTELVQYIALMVIGNDSIDASKYDNRTDLIKDVAKAKVKVLSGQYAEEVGTSVSLYPNPTKGNFTIEINGDIDLVVELYNSLGQIVQTMDLPSNAGTSLFINGERGLYFVVIKDTRGNYIKTMRIIKA